MSAQTTTIASGILLLVVFVLVAWNLKRRRSWSGQRTGEGKQHGES